MNGQELKLPESSTLEDAIKVSNAPYKKGTAIGILIEKEDQKSQASKEYLVKTSKGEFKIELIDESSPSSKRWISIFKELTELPVRWTNKDVLAFGPFSTEMEPSREKSDMERFTLLFGAGGGDAANTHIIVSKTRHSAEYGAPEEGVFARLISGKHVISDLDRGDRILSVEPVVEWEKVGEHISTTDLSTKLEDGYRIFTYIKIEIDPLAPEGAEFFFSVTRDGTFHIDYLSTSFISDHRFQGELVTYENFEARSTGSVFVRTVGYGAGKLFISTDARTSSIMHSVIGHVVQGIELARIAEKGQKVMLESVPDQVMLLGMTNAEAEAEMSEQGIELTREGYTGDDGFIVKQSPSTTIEILDEKKVTVQGVDPEMLVEIELYDDLAPKTLDFFRHAVGLQYNPVGELPVMMTYENTYIFKAEKPAESYKEIFPENTPSKTIAGEIGVTNQAAKRAGMIGVKLADDDLFGPTGERFGNTNIIGKILNPEKLKHFKDNDLMYVLESSKEE
ncbi:methyl-coenzyme M reductase-associated protein Mmp3 [Methanolobus tindarius]|uniref:methyl-coenzyme M reductase-associated protein Mmp3 n=1 Tax=Methanolobus tindarius TaxID=2221 RepID=UPI00316AD836